MKALRTKEVHEIAFVKCKMIVMPVGIPSKNGWTITLSTAQEVGKEVNKGYMPLTINKPMSKEFSYQEIKDIQSELNLPEDISPHEAVEYLNVYGALLLIDQAEEGKEIFGSLKSDSFDIIDSPILP